MKRNYRKAVYRLTGIFTLFVLLIGCNSKPQHVVDHEGKSYPVVKIGSMNWMAKNLDVAHYRNGEPIPEVRDSTEWANLTTGAWCYNDNKAEHGATYGKIYNWYAVNDSRGLAPQGWHVATDAEWSALATELGGEELAGGALKLVSAWKGAEGVKESGFNALPGGARRDTDGGYMVPGNYSRLWTSTELNQKAAWARSLGYFDTVLRKGKASKKTGFSVRCVKD